MTRRNGIALTVIVIIFALAVCSLVFPVGNRAGGFDGMSLGLDLKGGLHLVFKADMSQVASGQEANVIEGVIGVIQNRVNPLGVSEPVIEKLGDDQIVVQLPGTDITEEQKARIGTIALLEFREPVYDANNNITNWKPATGTVNGQEKVLTSAYFRDNTFVDRTDLGNILLIFEWDAEGAQLSEQVTGRLINKPLGIFENGEPLLGEDGTPIAPIVQSVIKDRGQIEGLSLSEASLLSKQLNAGRLPVPLTIIYEQEVSPIAGADFTSLALKAGIIGLLLVMAFMIAYYKLSGVLASLSLLFYAAIVLAIFKLIPVTLTLAGIGGFVVSLGMAVDANILIFERMKEEFKTGRTLGAAIEAGFNRAWTAIRDSNLTTIIAVVILYIVGSNIVAGAPVKGFALTLGIGIVLSMFTALLVTRSLLRLFIRSSLAHKTSLFTPLTGKENK